MPRRRELAAAAAGAALALTLPKPGLCFLAWGAPAVLLHLAPRAASLRRGAALGLAFGAAFAGVAFHWLYLTCRFAGMPVPAALLAWGALSVFLALDWALFAAAMQWFAGRLPEPARPWAWAAVWTAIDHGALRWTPRLGGDLLAYTQWRYLFLIQVGALAGPHALGFVLLAANGAAAELWAGLTRRRLANALLAGGLLFGCAGYGLLSLASRPAAPRLGPTAVILQPNIDQYRKWDERYAGDIRAGLSGLLKTPVPRDSLTVWPESSLPGWLDEEENSGWLGGQAKALGAPMVVGAVVRLGARRHNAAVLIGADGKPAGLYAKRRLVPFGEFVPLRRVFQPLIGILAELGDFDAGPAEQPLFATPLGPAAASLCYEAAFPRLVRSDAARGARVLLNLTNDGWYKDTWGPLQHFQLNSFRAVENRATVVRAANTGISGVFDPWGVTTASTTIMTRARLEARLPADDPFPRGSPYSRTGDWLGVSCLALTAAGALWGLRRGRPA